MSPRPRSVDDAEIATALGRVIAKVGPAGLTLTRLAREAGLSPAALVQRFGSKRRMLVKLSRGAGDFRPLADALLAEGKPPLEVVRALLLCFAGMGTTPTAMIHHFSAYLQIDLGDPVLRKYVVESGRRNERLVTELLDDAVRRGQVWCEDTPGLARVLWATVVGSLLSWATFREGKAAAWLSRDIDTMLRPFAR